MSDALPLDTKDSKNFLVKRIVEIPCTNNEYGIGRIETWIIQDVKKFRTYEEAEKYVIDMSIYNTDLVRCMPDKLIRHQDSLEEKQKFYKEFCFGEHFRKYQRYFINTVPLQEILELLQKDGIRIDNIQMKRKRFL